MPHARCTAAVPGRSCPHGPRLLLHGRRLRGSVPEAGVAHRKTQPDTPRPNGMVERFDGRVQRDVLGTTRQSAADLEMRLEGVTRACTARGQRVLGARPEEFQAAPHAEGTPVNS